MKLTVNQREAANGRVRAYEDEIELLAGRRIAFALGYDAGVMRERRMFRGGHSPSELEWILFGRWLGSKSVARVTGVCRELGRGTVEREWFDDGLRQGRQSERDARLKGWR